MIDNMALEMLLAAVWWIAARAWWRELRRPSQVIRSRSVRRFAEWRESMR